MKLLYNLTLNKKVRAFAIMALALPFGLFAQSKVIDYDTTIFTKDKIDCIYNNIILSFNNDTLYFIDEKLAHKNKYKKVKISGLDTKTNKMFSFYFSAKNCNNLKDKRNHISRFWIKDNNLYINVSNHIYVFNKNKDNEYVFQKEVNKPKEGENYDAFPLKDNKILLYKNYLGLFDTFDESTCWLLYDLEKEEVIQRKEYLNFPSPILTYFGPRDIISISNDRIFYSPANEYKILIYDFNLNLVDSIVHQKKNWIMVDEEKEKQVLNKYEEPIERLNAFSNYFWDSTSSIMRLFTSNDYLIVVYKGFNDSIKLEIGLYDVWHKENNEWKLIEEANEETINYIKNKFYPFGATLLKDNIIIQIKEKTPIKREDYKSEEKYQKAKEKYILNEDCLLVIEKFHIKQ
ncbi:MAG: hypothetical protein LBM25_01950 [Bacteroidales bacterium]|jgi:hypothetical protein|nr:hypothetical protein [Bacteroidales bacterium]